MAINFSDKIMVTSPTLFHLGRAVGLVGMIVVGVGIVTRFTGQIVLPPSAWCVFGIPAIAVGVIMVISSLTRR